MVDHINNGESGLIVRGKLNEVIDRTNTLNGIEDKVETNKQNIAKNATEIDELWAHVDDVEDTIKDLDVSVLDDKIDQEILDRTEGDANLQDQIDTLEGSISDGGGFIEAPNDGKLYGRQSEDWAEVVIPEPGEGYDDTQIKADLATETQARIDGDAALQGQINGLDLSGTVEEAPNDGKQYARQDASWSEIVLPEGDAPSLLYGSWSYNSSSAPTGSFTTRNANWFTATTLTLHKNDTSGYEHSFELMTEGDVIVVQAPSGGAEYRVISKTVYADFCDFVVDTISAFGTFPSNGYSVDFNFVPQIASGAGMVISAAEPVDPIEGMQWLNSNTAEVFIFDGAVWLEFPAGSSGSGGGLWEADGDNIYYSDGKVGIGTDVAEAKLHVSGGADTAGFYRNIDVDNVGAALNWIQLGSKKAGVDTPAANFGGLLEPDGLSGSATIGTLSNGTLTERMRIGADGKVDVGEIRVPRSMDNIFVGSFGPSLSDDSAVVIENSGGMRSSLTLTSSNSAEFSGRVIADDIEGVRFYRKATGGLTIGSGSIIPVNQSGVAENNLISLGTAAYKWKQVHAVTTRSSSFIQDGSPVIDAKGLINTLSTLHRATMDETKDIRESLRSAIEELVEGFEQEIATMPAGDSE
jgi:hypothetical protein